MNVCVCVERVSARMARPLPHQSVDPSILSYSSWAASSAGQGYVFTKKRRGVIKLNMTFSNCLFRPPNSLKPKILQFSLVLNRDAISSKCLAFNVIHFSALKSFVASFWPSPSDQKPPTLCFLVKCSPANALPLPRDPLSEQPVLKLKTDSD